MNGLRDQDFRVNDIVIYLGKGLEPIQGVVENAHQTCGDAFYVSCTFDDAERSFSDKGQWLKNQGQTLFHRDAVTIDEHGRLTAINHDYVKPRPKIVRQFACKFKPFEQVLLRDADDQPWRKDLFDKRTDAHKPYVGLVLGKGWSQCIPFAGNEKLDGVVTP